MNICRMLRTLVSVFLFLGATYALGWIGEEYWTTISYSGDPKGGRTEADFLKIATPDGISSNGWIAYWITRTKYPNVHFEAFGHAVVRSDGRYCGYFHGYYDKEVAEVCGGFRILSRNKNYPYEQPPFEWVLAKFASEDATAGFHEHRIAYFPRGQVIYGDAKFNGDQFSGEYKGVIPEASSDPITINGERFLNEVYLLRKNVANVPPPKTGILINPQPYSDPHHRHHHSLGYQGHPLHQAYDMPETPPVKPEPKQCIELKTHDGRVFSDCTQSNERLKGPRANPDERLKDPRANPDDRWKDPRVNSDERLKDPRANPESPLYDPRFDPRTSVYNPSLNLYDPRYDRASDIAWRIQHGHAVDNAARNAAARNSPNNEPQRVQNASPPNHHNGASQLLPAGQSDAQYIVDENGQQYRAVVNSEGKTEYVPEGPQRQLRARPDVARRGEDRRYNDPNYERVRQALRNGVNPPIGQGAQSRDAQRPPVPQDVNVPPPPGRPLNDDFDPRANNADYNRPQIGEGADPEDQEDDEDDLDSEELVPREKRSEDFDSENDDNHADGSVEPDDSNVDAESD